LLKLTYQHLTNPPHQIAHQQPLIRHRNINLIKDKHLLLRLKLQTLQRINPAANNKNKRNNPLKSIASSNSDLINPNNLFKQS